MRITGLPQYIFIRLVMVSFLIGTALPDQAKSEDYIISLSTSNCRALAMGGAFVAVNDDLATSNFNPATFDLYRLPKNFKITFFLNPITSAASLTDRYMLDENRQSRELAKSLAWLVKGITFSAKFIAGGFIFSEESLYYKNRLRRDKFLDFETFGKDISHSFLLRFRLSEQVAVGFTTTLLEYRQETMEQRDLVTSYGAMLKPNERVTIGVAYFGLAKKLPNFREPIQRMMDDTINLGLAYEPFSNTLLSCDIRNLNQIENWDTFEIHAGVEQTVFSLLALRGGYFQTQTQHQCFSTGIGLIDSNHFVKSANKFGHNSFLFNYSLVFEKTEQQSARWHFFSFILRL
ncbi:hypothetical protein JXJ21_11795 [candidate division KSB1 bacterium]|nr:hypothetical protein [candidate division KSB1 bacterium]